MIAKRRKFLVALTGFLTETVSIGIVHGTAEHVLIVIVGLLTTVTVHQVPNATS
jgi:hypothetical protein